MTEIKRYQEYSYGVEETVIGEFVKHEDHTAIVAAKDARIAELASREQWHSQRTASFDILNRKNIDLQEQVRDLAAENAALNNFISASCYVQAGEELAWHPAIDHAPETTETNRLSLEESQFLTDVINAAGLLSNGKQDKGLARRITNFCIAKRNNSNPARIRSGEQP